MTLDRRLPGVYIDIEDRSPGGEVIETGRSAYVVIISDQGAHNKIVELNARQDLYDMFNKPDFAKYGQGHYIADQVLAMNGRCYVCRPVMLEPFGDADEDDCMSIANAYIKMNSGGSGITIVNGDFTFVKDSNIVLTDTTSLTKFSIGEWIYSEHDSAEYACQVIEINTDENQLILDKNYTGTTASGDAYKFHRFEISFVESMNSKVNLDPLRTDVLWYWYAIGAGEPYNSYFIKGIRNIEFERLYIDDDGNPLYPYAFMDIAIYQLNEDKTTTIKEGPWTVSLISKTPSGAIIKDIYTGQELWLPSVINRNSKLFRCVEAAGASSLLTTGVTHPYELDTVNRLYIQSLLSEGSILGMSSVGSGGVYLQGGSNGNLFDSLGNLNLTEEYQALIAQAYNGSLESEDGSIELIVQSLYPRYLFDYVLTGGYNRTISNAARQLVDNRGEAFLLSDTGELSLSADSDITIRRNNMSWNTWNAAIYTQYRKISDIYTGKSFWVTPVYHAIERHLYVDSKYWIAEPVAGIEKGAIQDDIELAYIPNNTKMGDMLDVELNPTIVEPDGIYFLDQKTAYKRLSIMKRQHAIKFVQELKKKIPSLLKDIVQRKATNYWINEAKLRINGYMNKFLDRGDSDRYAAITKYSASLKFDDTRSELYVSLAVTIIRSIERITVNILVS